MGPDSVDVRDPALSVLGVCVMCLVLCALQAARGGASYSHPYDLGVCGNLHALCGGNAPAWLLPTRAAAAGDGVSFPTTWDSGLGF